MSSFDQSIVDANGNIKSSLLVKELTTALEGDIHHKQTDSMKKRAVKVSRDYDEFKNMVAAAHLKTLTKSEVESLSAVKKGWQKESMSAGMKEQKFKTTAQLLAQERERENMVC